MDIIKEVLLPQFKLELRKYDVCICVMDLLVELSRNVQSENTQNL